MSALPLLTHDRSRYNFACSLELHLADHDGAIDLLAPVFARDVGHLVNAATSDPDLDGLRGDPSFEKILADAQARLGKTA